MRRALLFALHAFAAARHAAAARTETPAADPLRGEYGFLTRYEVSELEARQIVRKMASIFGIMEFQFYDAFESYSSPPAEGKLHWECAAFGHPVTRSILEAYIDEIAEQGGRAWLYVQAMATTPGDKQLQQEANVTVVGQHMVDDKPLLDAVAPTAKWAEHIAPRWADWAVSLGFHGIHWDTLGNFEGKDGFTMSDAGADLPGFLRAASLPLAERGLAQTFNFVDGFGWDASLLGTGWYSNVIAFPYWEVWTVPEVERLFYEEVPNGGVIACYPGSHPDHQNRQNHLEQGRWPIDLLIERWQQARCHRSTYLAIGDGFRHIQNEYFPDTAAVSAKDVAKIRDSVFVSPPSCEGVGPSEPPLLPEWAWATIVAGLTLLLGFSIGLHLQMHVFPRYCAKDSARERAWPPEGDPSAA